MLEYVLFENTNNGASIELNDEFFPMNKLELPVDVRGDDKAKMQNDGQWPTYTYLGKRLIRCEGDAFGSNSDDYIRRRRNLVRALLPQKGNRAVGNLTLRFSGMVEDLTAECTIDGYPELPIEALSPAHTGYQITFKCFDPVMYGKTLNIATSDPSSAPLGRTYPKTYPKAYASIAGIPGEVNAENLGDVEVLPTVVVYGPVTGPELQLLVGEVTQVLSMPSLVLSSSDTLTLDFKNRTATSVELGDVYSSVTGTWWSLLPGDNSVRFFAFDSSSPARADFTWHNGYML